MQEAGNFKERKPQSNAIKGAKRHELMYSKQMVVGNLSLAVIDAGN
jgi:hypothetical protein